MYNFYFRQTAILFLYLFNFIPFLFFSVFFFFPTFFVLILSYLSGTCSFFIIADISGRNFLSSLGHFWAELFSQVGGCTRTQCTTPPVRTRLSSAVHRHITFCMCSFCWNKMKGRPNWGETALSQQNWTDTPAIYLLVFKSFEPLITCQKVH